MLHVIVDPPDGRWSYQKTLVDEYRAITFAALGTVAAGSILAFRLDWADRTIPVTASARDYVDDDGHKHREYSHVQVNGAGIQMMYGIAPHTFASENERTDAEQIAIECTLAFGQMAQNYTTAVEQDGKQPLTLHDFGY